MALQLTATHNYEHPVGEVFDVPTDFDGGQGEDGSVTLHASGGVPSSFPTSPRR